MEIILIHKYRFKFVMYPAVYSSGLTQKDVRVLLNIRLKIMFASKSMSVMKTYVHVVLPFVSVVEIKIKPLRQYFGVVPFVFRYFTK